MAKRKFSKKKSFTMAGIILLVILIIFFTIYFIVPSFSNNKYGDRLEGESHYKVTSDTISKIKDDLNETDGVSKVDYHKEGRLLNFTVTFDEGVNIETAKGVMNTVVNDLSKTNKKYYDVQVLLKSSKDAEGFPNIGYKHHASEDISWGNAGESSE